MSGALLTAAWSLALSPGVSLSHHVVRSPSITARSHSVMCGMNIFPGDELDEIGRTWLPPKPAWVEAVLDNGDAYWWRDVPGSSEPEVRFTDPSVTSSTARGVSRPSSSEAHSTLRALLSFPRKIAADDASHQLRPPRAPARGRVERLRGRAEGACGRRGLAAASCCHRAEGAFGRSVELRPPPGVVRVTGMRVASSILAMPSNI